MTLFVDLDNLRLSAISGRFLRSSGDVITYGALNWRYIRFMRGTEAVRLDGTPVITYTVKPPGQFDATAIISATFQDPGTSAYYYGRLETVSSTIKALLGIDTGTTNDVAEVPNCIGQIGWSYGSLPPEIVTFPVTLKNSCNRPTGTTSIETVITEAGDVLLTESGSPLII